MGIFDGGDIDPLAGGLLGATQAYAQGLGPSQLPINPMQGILGAIGGFGQGYNDTQMGNIKQALYGAQSDLLKQKVAAQRQWQQMFGVPGADQSAMAAGAPPPSAGGVLGSSASGGAASGLLAPQGSAAPQGAAARFGIPQEILPYIGMLGPEEGGKMLAGIMAKQTESGQWTDLKDETGRVIGSQNRFTGEKKFMPPEMLKKFVEESRTIDGKSVPGKRDINTNEWHPLDPTMTKVSVGLNMPPQESKESETVGTFYGKAYTDLQRATLENPSKRAAIGQLDSLLDQANTGKFTGTTLELKKAAKAAGINLDALGIKDDVAPLEASRVISNAQALELRNPAGGAGMPGALSDADRSFLVNSTPGMDNTQAGRKLMNDYKLRLLDREDKVAQMARDYRKANGHIDEGFFTKLAEFSAANPIFKPADVEKAQKVGGAGPANDPLGLFK